MEPGGEQWDDQEDCCWDEFGVLRMECQKGAGLILVRLGRREERAWVVEQQQLLVLVIRAELESQSEPASCV